ncbi:hypothetical protein F01_420954 [Burkholderia cenocepacia]|nr:hypothetical protein F01_420954 [Burkholderia cenocepacia]
MRFRAGGRPWREEAADSTVGWKSNGRGARFVLPVPRQPKGGVRLNGGDAHRLSAMLAARRDERANRSLLRP